MIREYEIIIRSHTDAPDYQDHCTAQTKDEAARIFQKRIIQAGGEAWDINELKKNIQ